MFSAKATIPQNYCVSTEKLPTVVINREGSHHAADTLECLGNDTK